uniref:Unspecified product n=1 Tax=Parastrongyloides trichosuri TaxID=131310 RepID=A0A0N4ZNQ3_PARTI
MVKNGKLTLKPNETFEIYEHRRTTSPSPNVIMKNYSDLQTSINYDPKCYYPNHDQKYLPSHIDNHNEMYQSEHNIRMPMDISSFNNKRKFPLVLIIAAAIAIPLFIILCMFIAVWLQELGFLK